MADLNGGNGPNIGGIQGDDSSRRRRSDRQPNADALQEDGNDGNNGDDDDVQVVEPDDVAAAVQELEGGNNLVVGGGGAVAAAVPKKRASKKKKTDDPKKPVPPQLTAAPAKTTLWTVKENTGPIKKNVSNAEKLRLNMEKCESSKNQITQIQDELKTLRALHSTALTQATKYITDMEAYTAHLERGIADERDRSRQLGMELHNAKVTITSRDSEIALMKQTHSVQMKSVQGLVTQANKDRDSKQKEVEHYQYISKTQTRADIGTAAAQERAVNKRKEREDAKARKANATEKNVDEIMSSHRDMYDNEHQQQRQVQQHQQQWQQPSYGNGYTRSGNTQYGFQNIHAVRSECICCCA